MDWFAVDSNIGGDVIVHRCAERFRIRVAEAVGLITLVLAGMAKHANDGDLSTITNSQIEAWALWHGKAGAFAAFFREQMCDASNVVVEWEDYNGAAMREAEASRLRSKNWRQRRKRERNAEGTPERTEDERRSERVSNASTGPDLTRQDSTSTSSAAEPYDAVGELLKRLPAEKRGAWAAEITVAKDGMHGKPLTPVQIDQACRDYVGNESFEKPSLRHFRAYLETVGRKATTGKRPPEPTTASGYGSALSGELP